MDAEATDLDAVGAADGFDGGGFAGNFDEGLAGVAVLVESADVAGGEGGGEWDGDGVLQRERQTLAGRVVKERIGSLRGCPETRRRRGG